VSKAKEDFPEPLTPVIVILYLKSFSFSQVYPIRNYTNADGLVQEQVISIFQDKKGFIWFGTKNGLCRYNGQSFIEYFKSTGLSGNYIYSIFQDSDGVIWFGTENGLTSIFKSEMKNKWLDEKVNCIRETPKGEFLIGTDSGLYIFKKKSVNELIFIEKVLSEPVISIYSSKNGDFYVTQINRILRYKEKFSPQVIFEGKFEVREMFIKEDKIILATDRGVWIKEGEKITHLTTKQGLFSDDVTSVLLDSRGKLWIGTTSGLNHVYKDKVIGLTEENGLIYSMINCLYEDRENNIWIGTELGVSKLLGEQFLTYLLTKIPSKKNTVWGIFRDSQDILWIGTDEGVYIFRDGKFKLFNSNLKNSIIRWILEDFDGKIWFLTQGDGIWIFDRRAFQHLTIKDGLISDMYTTGIVDRNGMIWLGSMNGFSIWDGEKFKNYSKIGGYQNIPIWCFLEDKEGKIWIGHDRGLSFYKEGKIIQFYLGEELKDETVLSLYQDTKGNIWIGTASTGVYRYNKSKNSFVHFTEKQGLSSNTIWGIVEDKNGFLWFATSRGLDKFDGKHFKNYNSKSYLMGDELQINAIFKDKDGSIWFGIFPGLLQYLPDEDFYNPVPPVININKIQIGNRFYSGKNLKFSYKDNDLTFHYLALSFKDEASIKYSTFLEGFDQNWSPLVPYTFIRYTHLSPGKYKFKVKAINNEGIWSEEAVLSFVIKTPFWRTPWFIAGEVLSVIFILILIYRLRLGYLEKQRIKLKRLVDEKTAELNEKIIQIEKLKKKAELMAITDELTGLYNRRFFIEVINKEIKRAERYQEKLGLLLIDLDHFKNVNDKFGHQAGDKVLKELAQILKNSVRKTDIIARYGGEEFVIILINPEKSFARDVAERIRERVENHSFKINSKSVRMTISIGISFYPAEKKPDVDYNELIKLADHALYEAKRRGRNKVIINPLFE
jgi:diguanylate cyclase (GGDEF)-like protein